jgi:hypothetical protein
MLESGDVDAIVTTVPQYLHTKIGKEALSKVRWDIFLQRLFFSLD